MREYQIDLREIYSADELHKLLRETLPLPEYYGGTLDSLYDVLSEPRCDWHIRFDNCAEAEAVLGKYFRSFKRMCERVTKENEKLEIAFEG